MRNFWNLLLLTAVILFAGCNDNADQDDAQGDAQLISRDISATPGHFASLTPPKKAGYRIEVMGSTGLPSQVYLAHHMGSKQFIRDTANTVGNRVVFEGEETLPGGIYMIVLPPKNNFVEVMVTYDQFFSMTIDTAKIVTEVKFDGTKENDIFYESLRFVEQKGRAIGELQKQVQAAPQGPDAGGLQQQMKDLNKELMDHRIGFMAKYPNSFYGKVLQAMRDPELPKNPNPEDSLFAWHFYRAHLLDGIDWADSQLVRTPVLQQKIIQYMDQLTVQIPDSLVKSALYIIDKSRANRETFRFCAITLLNKYAKSKIMGQDKVYVSIVKNAYTKEEAFWLDEEQLKGIQDRARALAPNLVDEPAPPFTMPDINGKMTPLYGMEGKFTILYFFDYDCGHCKTVTPKLAKLYPKYKDNDVALITVSINGDIEDWKTKIEGMGLLGIGAVNVQDHYRKTGFDANYDVLSTPRVFLLDKDKKILAKQITVYQLEDILDREFGFKEKVLDHSKKDEDKKEDEEEE